MNMVTYIICAVYIIQRDYTVSLIDLLGPSGYPLESPNLLLGKMTPTQWGGRVVITLSG